MTAQVIKAIALHWVNHDILYQQTYQDMFKVMICHETVACFFVFQETKDSPGLNNHLNIFL